MDIWHLSGPSNSGLPSAGTSLSTRIKADGHFSNVMTDVLYTDYGDAADVGLQVGGLGLVSTFYFTICSECCRGVLSHHLWSTTK